MTDRGEESLYLFSLKLVNDISLNPASQIFEEYKLKEPFSVFKKINKTIVFYSLSNYKESNHSSGNDYDILFSAPIKQKNLGLLKMGIFF